MALAPSPSCVFLSSTKLPTWELGRDRHRGAGGNKDRPALRPKYGRLEVQKMNNRAALDFRITDDAETLDARAGMENGTPGDFTGAGDLDAGLNAHES